MIKIGEFSRMARVPVATLRYYDQVGLLRPVEVDRFTGYRYYGADQMPRLQRIMALKGLGFSLEEIARLLDEEVSAAQMAGMLRLRQAQIRHQLAETQDQLADVEARLQQISQEDRVPMYDVIVRQVEPVLVAMVRTPLPAREAVGALFGEAYEAIGKRVDTAIAANPGEGGNTMVIWFDS